jgi:cytoskeletal protein CcmA (bactofilin family)
VIWRRETEATPASVPPPPERDRERERERKDRHMADNGEVTIVGTGARLEGNVVSAGSLRIDGQVKGQINADGDVTLSPQSQVEADIRAQNVSVAGKFNGNIVVKERAHLARGGRIDGNITSKTLVVEEGGVFHGQSIMDAAAGSGRSSGQAPSSSTGAAGTEAKQPDQVKVR